MQETEREIQYKHYIEGFYLIAKKMLTDFPEQWIEFEKQWQKREYPWAYIPYMEVKHANKLEGMLTPEEKKVETEFYWLFVN